jgi:glycosyltransferase involved in cell wall biosynthesis
MRVVHVSPQYFGDESTVGGGERYAQELARAMARVVPTSFVSFGPRRQSFKRENLQVEIFAGRPLPWLKNDPFSPRFLPWINRADVIHCHQLGTPGNVLALLTGRVLRKPRFLTPLGHSPTRGEHVFTRVADVSALLCISKFSADHTWYSAPRSVIYGGVDTERFRPVPGSKQRKVVCVARLVPHKGINYLIEALDSDMRLEVYGRPYDQRYYRDLVALAAGKNVEFFTEASDADIARAYTQALVAVLPSVHDDMYGNHIPQPELLGLVLLEAMACGTAVIGSNITSIPEYVQDGKTGYLVPPNDSAALRAALRRVLDDPDHASELGRAGCELVQREFTWDSVARRCLAAYSSFSTIV